MLIIRSSSGRTWSPRAPSWPERASRSSRTSPPSPRSTLGGRREAPPMTLDEYVTWAAASAAGRRAALPEDQKLLETALGFASEVGEVAGVLTKWLRDGDHRRDRLSDELGDVAYYWAQLCAVTGLAPSALLARSRGHVDWRR